MGACRRGLPCSVERGLRGRAEPWSQASAMVRAKEDEARPKPCGEERSVPKAPSALTLQEGPCAPTSVYVSLRFSELLALDGTLVDKVLVIFLLFLTVQ